MKDKSYSICEYGVIKNADYFDSPISSSDELYLPEKEFNSLYNYILSNQPLEGDIPFSLFSKGKKPQIKVRNYVGIIETQDGLSLEILPKIYEGEGDIKFTREIFLKMLKTLKNSPFLSLNTAHLSSKKNFPILEAFIISYIQETEKLFCNGVKAGYILKNQNLNYLKGKILVPVNIKHNSLNHAKFYCEFSELSEDIPQNRIIKSTILKLLKITKSYANYAQLNKLLTHLENVKPSYSYNHDLESCRIKNRLFKPYQQILEWSEIFLFNRGFTNFKGDSLNTAILFPMEKLFENYIAFLFKKYSFGYKIKAQDKSYFLVERHINSGRFRLKPDLYLQKNEINRIIIDTKWKLINEGKTRNNYDIKISDMYQLYAYGRKYSTRESIPALVIIYPKNENFTKKLHSFSYEENLMLNIFPFDFTNDEKSEIDKIVNYHFKNIVEGSKVLTVAAEDQADYKNNLQ